MWDDLIQWVYFVPWNGPISTWAPILDSSPCFVASVCGLRSQGTKHSLPGLPFYSTHTVYLFVATWLVLCGHLCWFMTLCSYSGHLKLPVLETAMRHASWKHLPSCHASLMFVPQISCLTSPRCPTLQWGRPWFTSPASGSHQLVSLCDYFMVVSCLPHSSARKTVLSCLVIRWFTCEVFVPLLTIVVEIDVPACLLKVHRKQSNCFKLHDSPFCLLHFSTEIYCTHSNGSSRATALFNVGEGSSSQQGLATSFALAIANCCYKALWAMWNGGSNSLFSSLDVRDYKGASI